MVLHDRITKRETTSINKYFNDLREYDPLTPDEENELCILSCKGDLKARNKLIKHNLRFVVSVAKQYEGNGNKIEDLINEGNIGLIKAAEKFDPTTGFKFISYAVHWIRRQIIVHINNNGKTIRIPMNKVNSNSQIKRAVEPFEKSMGRPLSYYELIDKLGSKFTEGEIKFFINGYVGGVDSLDKEWKEGGSMYNNYISSDDSVYDPSNKLNSDDSTKNIKLLFNQLTEDEQKVITLFYGLGDNEPVKLKDIGGLINLSHTKVMSAKMTGLRKLRISMNKNADWILRG